MSDLCYFKNSESFEIIYNLSFLLNIDYGPWMWKYTNTNNLVKKNNSPFLIA